MSNLLRWREDEDCFGRELGELIAKPGTTLFFINDLSTATAPYELTGAFVPDAAELEGVELATAEEAKAMAEMLTRDWIHDMAALHRALEGGGE